MMSFSYIMLSITLLFTSSFAFQSKNVYKKQFSSLQMATGPKSEYLITTLPGDGIGPEIVAATIPVLNAIATKFNFKFKFQEGDIGGIAIDRQNDPFPATTYELCKNSDSILLGAVGGYKWDNNPRALRPETGLLKMRSSLGLFANLRPAKVCMYTNITHLSHSLHTSSLSLLN